MLAFVENLHRASGPWFSLALTGGGGSAIGIFPCCSLCKHLPPEVLDVFLVFQGI